MKLTFRVNGARLGDAARPVNPTASASDDVAPAAASASAGGPRRFGLRVNRGTLGGVSRADLSARPTAIAPEGSEPTIDPTVDRSAS